VIIPYSPLRLNTDTKTAFVHDVLTESEVTYT
jgi:hypothetical protein